MKGEATYTTEDAARELGITASRVRQLVLDGTIRAEKRGRDLFITEGEIEKARSRKGIGRPSKKGRVK